MLHRSGLMEGVAALAVAIGASLCATGAAAQDVRILQTNSRDSIIHLIDPTTHSIVGQIDGVPVNHGAAASPDGGRLYFSSEAKETLDVIDGRTFEHIAEIPLSARPNNISIGKDGRFVYVGIMGGAEVSSGGIDVIDTQSLERVRTISTGARVHNIYVTPDGKYLVASMFEGDLNLGVFDVETEELVWGLYPPPTEDALDGVRPIAFETNPDGTTGRMFVQISNFHGFTVVDFASGEEIDRVELPSLPEDQQDEGPFNAAPAHGIGVAPDGQTLWVCSRLNGYVYAYGLPDLEYLGGVKVGSHPDWLTFTPDSRFVYVANGYSDDVSVIDIAAREEVARVPVGSAPKRNITAVLP